MDTVEDGCPPQGSIDEGSHAVEDRGYAQGGGVEEVGAAKRNEVAEGRTGEGSRVDGGCHAESSNTVEVRLCGGQ